MDQQDTPTTTPEAEKIDDKIDDKIDIEQFLKVELRVARIDSVEAVPKSKKLLKLQLDVGQFGKRQILSGIAQFYTPEALIGRHIVIVANLKPANLMGQQSEGMLLAASTTELSQLVILDPGQTMPPGSLVR